MVDCTALERRHVRLGHRGFESLSFRQNPMNPVELHLRGFLLLADFFLRKQQLALVGRYPPPSVSIGQCPSFWEKFFKSLRYIRGTSGNK